MLAYAYFPPIVSKLTQAAPLRNGNSSRVEQGELEHLHSTRAPCSTDCVFTRRRPVKARHTIALAVRSIAYETAAVVPLGVRCRLASGPAAISEPPDASVPNGPGRPFSQE